MQDSYQGWHAERYNRRTANSIIYTKRPLVVYVDESLSHYVDYKLTCCFSTQGDKADLDTKLFAWKYVHRSLPCEHQYPSMKIHYEEWPVEYKELFVNPRLSKPQRAELFRFIWANGAPAEWACELVLRSGIYDDDAKKHVWDLVVSTKGVDRHNEGYGYYRLQSSNSHYSRIKEADEDDDSCECGYWFCPHYVRNDVW